LRCNVFIEVELVNMTSPL